MRFAVIDLGADTIQSTVYEQGKNGILRLYREEEAFGLLDYVHEGALSGEGISRLVLLLRRMTNTAGLLHCGEVCCISAAVVHTLKNRQYLEECLQNDGILLQTLNTSQEANFLSSGFLRETKLFSGVCCDMGGNTTKLFSIANGQLAENAVLPIGGLRGYREFVGGLLPSWSELHQLAEFTKHMLENYPEISLQSGRTLWLMGGTAQMLKILVQGISGQGMDSLSADELSVLTNTLNGGGFRTVELLERLLPNRVHTVLPTLAVLQSVGKHLHIEEYVLCGCGLSDGYALEKANGQIAEVS